MNTEILSARMQEIDTAIFNTTAQLNALHGHKAETAHWISKMQAEADSKETQVESDADAVVE